MKIKSVINVFLVKQKARPAFQQNALRFLCGYFSANGINLVHFCPISANFGVYIAMYRYIISQSVSSWGLG